MTRMKKKVITLCLTLSLATIAIVGGTLAYFTDTTGSKENVFTVGNVNIELTEPSWDSTGSVDAPEIYPGEALAKDPTVTNVGANPCFVRMKVTGLDQFVGTFGSDAMITLRHGEYVAGYDSTNWTLHTDGYYYYNKVLATDATAGDEYNQGLGTVTEPLFNQIVMPTQLTNNAVATPIVVYAEAVQAQGAQPSWSAVKSMTTQQVADWFTTCGMP